MDKRCAVIGNCGYIGRHIVHYLKAHYGIIADCYDIVNCNQENYTRVDLTDKESVEKIDLNVDYIFLFSGLTGTYAGFEKYEAYVILNELGLLNLLDFIRHSEYRPKIIFPSTRLIYKGVDKPLKEDDEKNCKTVYSVNKLACECLLHAYWCSFDIPYTIFRICVPYGNLLSNDYSFGTIGFFIKQASLGKNITLYGDGHIKRTFTHVEDLCIQLIDGAFTENSNGKVYNIGGETLSLYEAAKIIAKKYGVRVQSVEWPERDLRIESDHTYFDDSRIRSLVELHEFKRLTDFTNDL